MLRGSGNPEATAFFIHRCSTPPTEGLGPQTQCCLLNATYQMRALLPGMLVGAYPPCMTATFSIGFRVLCHPVCATACLQTCEVADLSAVVCCAVACT